MLGLAWAALIRAFSGSLSFDIAALTLVPQPASYVLDCYSQIEEVLSNCMFQSRYMTNPRSALCGLRHECRAAIAAAGKVPTSSGLLALSQFAVIHQYLQTLADLSPSQLRLYPGLKLAGFGLDLDHTHELTSKVYSLGASWRLQRQRL